MTPELWDKIKTLFSSAQDLPAGERKGFLTGACDGDAILRSEVEKLLDSHEVDDNFLEDSAVAEAASIFDERKAAQNGSTPPISSQFDAGMVVNDRYQIIRLLGRGGMGEVYLAKDERINRNVALKALHPNLVANKESLRRFALEAQAVSALNHPNIVTIYEFDSTADGTRFFVTEYVEGQTIGQLIGSVIDIETILNILIQAASALSAAHAAGIVHRDIKPDNIMIRSDGYIKVLDFGLAKLSQHEISPSNSGSEDQTKVLERTQPGVVMGTAAYMSPEQARGRETDPRTDVWSLGVVLYELITGRKPFPGETPADIVVSVLSTEPRPISEYVDGLPSELEWAISKSLSKDVDGRYQTVKGLRADLERIKKQIEYDRTAGRTADISRISDESEENVPVEVRPTVAESPRPTDGGLGVDPDADEIGSSLSFSSFVQKAADHRLGASVIAVVLIALITSAVYFAVVPRRQTVIDSIAVLPFENIGGDPDQAYAADGISESLIDRLSQLAEVKVISRNSSFKFRGPDIDVRNAASQLGVRAVLTGSISRSGDDMVVRYDIVDTVEDRQLAGGQVRQKANELQSIQDQISIKIVEQLRLKLTGVQQERIVTPKPNNADAYRYYLSGLVEMNGPDNTNRRALEYFEKAVSLDPELAEAYVELAWIHWWRANASTDPSEVMPKAIAATKRALEIDPNLSKAHALQAMMYEYEFNWPEAEREYLRAIELSPNLDFNRNNFSFFLSVMGRQDEALAQLEEQRLRDPINPRMAFLQKAIILVQARKFDDALAAYREAQAIEPSEAVPDFALGYAYAGKGNYRQAAEYFQKAVNDVGGPEKYSQSLVYLAATYAKIPEKQAEARAILARLDSSSAFASPALLAAVDSALGNKEKAFELLEKAYIKKDLLLRYVGVAFEYDDIRDDPRFKDLLRRTGLPDHAK